VVFPGALINYKGAEIPVNLLKNNPGAGAEVNINNSIQSFEFEFMRVISSIASDTTEKIAFIEGHGEFNEYQVGDITGNWAGIFRLTGAGSAQTGDSRSVQSRDHCRSCQGI